MSKFFLLDKRLTETFSDNIFLLTVIEMKRYIFLFKLVLFENGQQNFLDSREMNFLNHSVNDSNSGARGAYTGFSKNLRYYIPKFSIIKFAILFKDHSL